MSFLVNIAFADGGSNADSEDSSVQIYSFSDNLIWGADWSGLHEINEEIERLAATRGPASLQDLVDDFHEWISSAHDRYELPGVDQKSELGLICCSWDGNRFEVVSLDDVGGWSLGNEMVLAFRVMDDGYYVYLLSVQLPGWELPIDDTKAEPAAILNPRGTPAIRCTSLAPDEPVDDTKCKKLLRNLQRGSQ